MSVNAVRIRNASGEDVFVLKEQNFVVCFGRDKKTCHVAFDPQAARVSRVHASLEWTEEGVVFTDKSKEGSYIEGLKIKQTSQGLNVGFHKIQIGGIPITIEVEEAELDETVPDSPSPVPTEKVEETPAEQNAPSTVVEPVIEVNEELDDIGSMYSMEISSEAATRKRRSNSTLFEHTQPRGKKSVPKRQLDFDEEMENRGRKGPRARKAEEVSVFDSETPAKKKKPTLEPKSSQRLMMNYFKQPKSKSPERDNEVDSISSKVAALQPISADASKSKEEIALDLEMAMQMDRGPAAQNETIKYANLIFRPQHLSNHDLMVDRTLPNFKKFKPKSAHDGRTSAMSMFSTTTCASHVTTTLIDSRRL